MGEVKELGEALGSVLIYQDASTMLQVRLDGSTVWLSQRQIAELYQVSTKTVSEHLSNLHSEGELSPSATIRQFRIVQTEGTREVARSIDHYDLSAILAVGYRVRSTRGMQFRQWATARLSELLVKGFTMDDERIKAGRTLGTDYFVELLERIRDIRSSERLFYQTVQNKIHWAAHGHTAAEIIHERADASQPNMGLTSWKNAPAPS